MKISFAEVAEPKSGVLAVLVAEGSVLSGGAQSIDAATGGQIARALENGTSFAGKAGQTLVVAAPHDLPAVSHVVLLGVGKVTKIDAAAAADVGGTLMATLLGLKAKAATVLAGLPEGSKLEPGVFAAQLAYGALLRSYAFDNYKSKAKKADAPVPPASLVVATEGPKHAKKQFQSLQAVAEGVFLTRDLVWQPPNLLYPETFVAQVTKELEDTGIEIEVLDAKKMKKLGMGALLGVAQGSAFPPAIMIMRWNGGKKDEAPLAVIGKGVTFDSGGLSLKPAASMEDMKWDMGGAGVVSGLMKALAGRKAKVNVIGAIGLVENMPDGNAQRPGDVVTSMSGQTIEVLNTDAEGRLVLADVLWYVKETYQPTHMVDLATLTGAIIVGLGHEYAGLFSNDDKLAKALEVSGKATGEKLWRFPLDDAYDRMLDCDIADMKNIGPRGEAGSITAAQFLKRFVGDTKWAHLDIAGTTWSGKDKPTVPKGGTAFGVRLLDDWVAGFEV